MGNRVTWGAPATVPTPLWRRAVCAHAQPLGRPPARLDGRRRVCQAGLLRRPLQDKPVWDLHGGRGRRKPGAERKTYGGPVGNPYKCAAVNKMATQ